MATATSGADPVIMLTGPTPATRKVLDRAGLTVDDIDLFELNEAFASVVLKFQKDLNIPDEKLNVNGGAIAMGHPLGATGAMITGTMVDELERRGARARARSRCASAAAWVSRPSSRGCKDSMAENTIQWDKDADGIVTLTLDDPTGSANVMNEHYKESMHKAVERLVAEKDSITGVVITSAKKTFFAGGDLKGMINLGPENAGEAFDEVEAIKARPAHAGDPRQARRRGHQRRRARRRPGDRAGHATTASPPTSRASVIGLPEVTLGLLPGGGGVTRTVRMFGIQKAFMEVLSQGTRFKPAKAKEIGLVDELVGSVDELVPAAKAWIKANPEAHTQPWDAKGYKMPGGTPSQPGAGGDPAVVPGAAAQAAQGCADARAAGHPGRGRRGCAGGLRHRQPHREPLLHRSWSPARSPRT